MRILQLLNRKYEIWFSLLTIWESQRVLLIFLFLKKWQTDCSYVPKWKYSESVTSGYRTLSCVGLTHITSSLRSAAAAGRLTTPLVTYLVWSASWRRPGDGRWKSLRSQSACDSFCSGMQLPSCAVHGAEQTPPALLAPLLRWGFPW